MHGPLALTVFVDVFQVKTRWQVHVHLQGVALPVATNGVAQYEFKLRPLKRAFAQVDLIGQLYVVHCGAQRALQQIPSGEPWFSPNLMNGFVNISL